jgi:hypothetical protein
MKKDELKRYFYVVALHQSLNNYVLAMPLILSELFKVETLTIICLLCA